MRMKLLLCVFSVSLFISCSDDVEIDNSDLLIGSWTNQQVNDNIFTFQRSAKLNENEYGFTFEVSGRFIERTISGWCATPPVSFGDNHGSWSRSDSVVSITITYWGGLGDYKWKIISVDNSTLKMYKVSQIYRAQ